MKALNQQLHRILSAFTITLFTVLILDVVLGVVSRYIFDAQIRWTEELATFLLVWLVFSGSAIAFHDRAHLGIDILVRNLSPEARRIADALSRGIVLIFVVGVMIFGGFLLFLERWDAGQMMSTLGIHKAWLYLSVPVNGLFIASFALEQLLTPHQATTTEEAS